MKFEHYSKKEFSLEERHYPQSSDMKPTGFWFSPENEDHVWYDFCSSEVFRLDRLKYRYTFNLDTSKILLIDSHDGIDGFYECYKGFGDVERALAQTNYARERRWSIDWAKVAEGYSGILISPYQHSQRLGKNMWYYGWDCASGCVWDTSVVSNWKLENSEV